MFASPEQQVEVDGFESWEEAQIKFKADYDDAVLELKNLNHKIEKSQVEVSKLAKRNASISAHLQQVQAQIESTPKSDIKLSYDAALDALQRLFVMRGQLERLKQEQKGLDLRVKTLQAIDHLLSEGVASSRNKNGNSFANVEMMIQAQESERQRLSRQMHDGPAQALSNFILQAEIATRLFDIDADKAREEMRMLKTSATTTFQQVRDFIFELRPMMLDDLGLIPTVKRYVDAIKEQQGAEINLLITGEERRLEPHIEVVVFRSMQELIHNATHHSSANEIKIQLDIFDNEVRATVEDNGRGFDVRLLDDEKSIGLRLIRERVEMLGGSFEIGSLPGQGARVSFLIPIVKQVDFA